MPREKTTQFDIICGLKELSDEADKALPLLDLEENSAFGIWFAAIKETFIKIRDCETLKDLQNVEYPPCAILEKEKSKDVNPEGLETLRENIHATVLPPISRESPENASKKATECKVYVKCDEIVANDKKSTAVTPFNSSVDACQVRVVKCDEIAAYYEKKSTEKCTATPSNSSVDTCQVRVVKCDEIAADYEKKSTEKRTVTPSNSSLDVLKKAADCQVRSLNCDKITAGSKSNESRTVVQTGSPIKLNNAVVKLERIDSPKLDATYNLCTPETDNELKSQELYRTPVLNLTFNNIVNKKLILNSDVSQSSNQKPKKVNNNSGVITRSASKLNTPLKNNSTRQGCKRKSSTSTDESSKKVRSDTSSADPASKTAQTKYPIRRIASKNNLTADSKTKVQAVIVPSVQPKQSVVSKEQQILEEIKKKEEKANKNIKRVLAERQQKAEQNKKNREEKRTKTLQKRMLLEKEKEVRLEKHEAEVKTSQVKTVKENSKNLSGKTRTKELIEQHMKENKLSGLSTSKQSANIINKTPVKQMIEEDDDCYELTPLPDSSTYNFSDEEEDDKPKGKFIPRWAQGVHLKNALILQFYNPIDTEQLFGTVIDTPNLAEIFKVHKKRYDKRTSSAIWNSPPVNKSFKH